MPNFLFQDNKHRTTFNDLDNLLIALVPNNNVQMVDFCITLLVMDLFDNEGLSIL